MFRRAICVLALGAAYVAGCSDGPTAPEEQLAEADVLFLTEEADAVIMGMLDDFLASDTGGASGAPALADPVVWTYTFERSRSCDGGGTVTIAGSGTRVLDRDAGTKDVESEGTKVRTDCGFVRGDVIITITGSGSWTHERHFLNGAPTGTWMTTWSGDFNWLKGSGESGSCSHDLTVTIDTAANTRTLVGTYCGREIDRSRTWRDG